MSAEKLDMLIIFAKVTAVEVAIIGSWFYALFG